MILVGEIISTLLKVGSLCKVIYKGLLGNSPLLFLV